MKKDSKFSDGTGKASMMRIGFWCCLLIDLWLILLMSADVIVNIVNKTPQDWQGLAVFMGAITALTTGAVWGKAYQKKIEENKKQNI